MITLRIIGKTARLLAGITGIGVGFFWRRSSSTRKFKRRLRRMGLPRDAVDLLSYDYEHIVSFSDLRSLSR
jgi:hypothetical protein